MPFLGLLKPNLASFSLFSFLHKIVYLSSTLILSTKSLHIELLQTNLRFWQRQTRSVIESFSILMVMHLVFALMVALSMSRFTPALFSYMNAPHTSRCIYVVSLHYRYVPCVSHHCNVLD